MSSVKLIWGLFDRYRNIVLYGIIGVFCAGIDFSVYNLLSWMSINYMIANTVSVNSGIFVSFFLNRQFNFKTKDKILRRFFSFYLIGFLGLGMSTLFLYVMIGKLWMDVILSKLITIVFVALLQFQLNKFITFNKPPHEKK